MTVARSTPRRAVITPQPALPESTWRVLPSDALLPTAVVLWLVGVDGIDATQLSGLGLVSVLPTVFFAGVGLLIVSIGLLLREARPLRRRLVLHLATLAVMLYGTAPLVYSEPRYAWLYKHIGVVQYIDAHGELARSIDIYHNWPGFFSVANFFDHVAGISSPLAVAAWAQLLLNLLGLVVLGFAFRALPLTWRERWLALFLFATANWVAQDYYSPQAAAFVLSIGVYAIVLHWCSVDNAPAWRAALSKRFASARAASSARPVISETDERGPRRRRPPPVRILTAILFVYSALVVMHELSPYVIVIQLSLLTVCGLLRPRWLVPVMLLIALLYLAPRFPYVDEKYGVLASFGNFFGNLRPPSQLAVQLSSDQLLIARAAQLLSVVVWVLAAVGVRRRRRVGRPVLALAILAFSPVFLIALQHYGGEALLRVYLFSLPWSACLAASAIAPDDDGHAARRWLAPTAVLLVSAGLFLVAYFGSDTYTRMSTGSVAASRYLDDHGQPGALLLVDENFPVSIGSRYHRFDPRTFLLENVRQSRTVLTAREVPAITAIARENALVHSTAYLVVSDEMLSYARAFGLTRSESLASFRRALDRSSEWRVFFRAGDTTVYQIRPSPPEPEPR